MGLSKSQSERTTKKTGGREPGILFTLRNTKNDGVIAGFIVWFWVGIWVDFSLIFTKELPLVTNKVGGLFNNSELFSIIMFYLFKKILNQVHTEGIHKNCQYNISHLLSQWLWSFTFKYLNDASDNWLSTSLGSLEIPHTQIPWYSSIGIRPSKWQGSQTW